jgi:hypothetical protein
MHGTRALLRESGGWRRALGAARTEGLLPLVAAAARAGLVSPPECIKKSLQTKRHLSRLMLVAAAETAADASRALANSNIPHTAIKGASIAPLYGDLSLRPMCDVDFLVMSADVGRASEALTGLGLVERKRTSVETEFAPPEGLPLGVSIDLHHRLAFPEQYAPDIGGILERSALRGDIYSLAPEDEILVASLDMARDCFAGVGRSMADVAVLTRTFEIDWDAVCGRALEWGLTAAAWIALQCARRAFGGRVPSEVSRTLRPAPAREAYLRAWLDTSRVSPYRMTRQTGGGATLSFAMCVLWPILIDGHVRRAKFLASYALGKMRIARTDLP